MIIAPGVISALRRFKIGQTISADGPESHQSKAGTPTMGGLIIVLGVIASFITAMIFLRNEPGVLGNWFAAIALMLAYSILGLVDDYLTIRPIKGVRGIASKPKAALQVLIATGFVLWLASRGFNADLTIAGKVILSGVWYYAFAVVFIVGMANFVNITDGLDGLVSGLAIIAAIGLVCIFRLEFYVKVDDGSSLLLSALAGACLAFLWFNTNPAKVFMGDTGSLAIGSLLPTIAIVTHREVLLIIVGMVFILDGLSSALQWAVFKYTRITTGTGRRVFKKSPVHHHFELCGIPEQAVVVRFWIAGVIAALIGIWGASVRWW